MVVDRILPQRRNYELPTAPPKKMDDALHIIERFIDLKECAWHQKDLPIRGAELSAPKVSAFDREFHVADDFNGCKSALTMTQNHRHHGVRSMVVSGSPKRW